MAIRLLICVVWSRPKLGKEAGRKRQGVWFPWYSKVHKAGYMIHMCAHVYLQINVSPKGLVTHFALYDIRSDEGVDSVSCIRRATFVL